MHMLSYTVQINVVKVKLKLIILVLFSILDTHKAFAVCYCSYTAIGVIT